MWALGCVLHYVACLEHPFLQDVATKGNKVNRQSIEYQILHSTPKPLPDPYSNRLRIVIQRLLEKDPIRRLSSMELIKLLPGSEEPDQMLQIKENYVFPEGKKYPELMSHKSSVADLHGIGLNKLTKIVEDKKEKRELRQSETMDILSKYVNPIDELQIVPQLTSVHMEGQDDTLNPITLNQEAFDAQLLDITNESVEALVQRHDDKDLLQPPTLRIMDQQQDPHREKAFSEQYVADVENRLIPQKSFQTDLKSSPLKELPRANSPDKDQNKVKINDLKGSLIDYFEKEDLADDDRRQSSPAPKSKEFPVSIIKQPPHTADKPPTNASKALSIPLQQSQKKKSDKPRVIIIDDSKPATANSLEHKGRQYSLDSQPMSINVNEPLAQGVKLKNASLEPSIGVKKILERRIPHGAKSEQDLGASKKVVQIVPTAECSPVRDADKRESTESSKNEIPYHQRIQSEQLQNMRNFQSQLAKTTIEHTAKKEKTATVKTFPKPPKNHSSSNLLPPMDQQSRAQTVGQANEIHHMNHTQGLPFSQLKDYFRIMSEQRGTKEQLSRLGLGVSKLTGNQSPPVQLNSSLLTYEKLSPPPPLVNLREKLINHQSAQGMTLSAKRLAPLGVKEPQIQTSPPLQPSRTLALMSKQHNYLINATPSRIVPSKQMKLSPMASLMDSTKFIDQSSINASSLIKPHKEMPIQDEQNEHIVKYIGGSRPAVKEETESLEESAIIEHQALVNAMKFRRTHEAFSSPLKPSIKSLGSQANSANLLHTNNNPFTSSVKPFIVGEPISQVDDRFNEITISNKYDHSAMSSVPDTRVETADQIVQQPMHTQSELFTNTTQYFMATRLSKSKMTSSNTSQLEGIEDKRDSSHNLYFAMTTDAFNKTPNDPRMGRFSQEKQYKQGTFFHKRRSSSSRENSGSPVQPPNSQSKILFMHSALSTTTGGDAWLQNASQGKFKQVQKKQKPMMGHGRKENKKSARFTVKDLQ